MFLVTAQIQDKVFTGWKPTRINLSASSSRLRNLPPKASGKSSFLVFLEGLSYALPQPQLVACDPRTGVLPFLILVSPMGGMGQLYTFLSIEILGVYLCRLLRCRQMTMYIYILACMQMCVYTVAGLCAYFFAEGWFPKYSVRESVLSHCSLMTDALCAAAALSHWQRHCSVETAAVLAVVLTRTRRAAGQGLQHQ